MKLIEGLKKARHLAGAVGISEWQALLDVFLRPAKCLHSDACTALSRCGSLDEAIKELEKREDTR